MAPPRPARTSASAASMAFTGAYLMALDLSRAFGLVPMGEAGPVQRDQHL